MPHISIIIIIIFVIDLIIITNLNDDKKSNIPVEIQSDRTFQLLLPGRLFPVVLIFDQSKEYVKLIRSNECNKCD